MTCNRYTTAKFSMEKNKILHNVYVGVYRTAPACKHFNEGYSTGHPFKNQILTSKIRYGCWFSYYPESSVYIQLHKPLFAESREHIAHITNTTNELPADYHWCDGAIKLGYRSIVIQNSNACMNTEIVICDGLCITRASNSSCPGVHIYDNTHKRCNCNNKSMEMTCDNNRKTCGETAKSSYNKLGYSIF